MNFLCFLSAEAPESIFIKGPELFPAVLVHSCRVQLLKEFFALLVIFSCPDVSLLVKGVDANILLTIPSIYIKN
jgi:hypothetical protein